MHNKLFEEIREVEAEARRILSDSEKQSAEILSKANNQALQALSRKEAELKELRANTINAASMQAAKERNETLEQGRKKLEELRKAANRKKEKALSLILGRLSKSIGE